MKADDNTLPLNDSRRPVHSAQGFGEAGHSTRISGSPATRPGTAQNTRREPMSSLPKVIEVNSAAPFSRFGSSSVPIEKSGRRAVCPALARSSFTHIETHPSFEKNGSKATPLPPPVRPTPLNRSGTSATVACRPQPPASPAPPPGSRPEVAPPRTALIHESVGSPSAMKKKVLSPTISTNPVEPEQKIRKQIKISPQVTEFDEHQNTATYTLLDDAPPERSSEAPKRRGSRHGRRMSHLQKIPLDGSQELPHNNRRLSGLFAGHSLMDSPICSPCGRTLADNSLHQEHSFSDVHRSNSHSQLFPGRAAFLFKEKLETDDPASGECSPSQHDSRQWSVTFARAGSPGKAFRRKSKMLKRRKSRRRSSIGRHHSTSILELPDGGYARGSPFRRDRFADLGPCPATEHKRIFCYNTFGDPSDPALVMINGMGSSCTLWPEDLCIQFAEKGLFVMRFDNRDVGLTSHWDGYPAFPMYKAAIMGILSKGSPPYGLKDMAQDTLDLMDYVGIGRAHVLGISMGGMIAQRVALMAPERIRSLSLIATHCPGYRVESPSLKLLMSNFLDSPKSNTLDAIVDFYIRRRQAIIGEYNADTAGMRELFRKSIIRAPGDRKGVRRHFWAVQNEESKAKEVRALGELGKFPVVIIHGKKDQLIPLVNAKANAGLWVGCELRVFEKMGHAIPEEVQEDVGAIVLRNVQRSEKW